MATSSRGRRTRSNKRGGRGSKQSNKSNKIGAAWENLDDDGNVAHIAVLLDEDATIHNNRVILFPNSYKELDKHPDYNVLSFPD